MWKITKKVMRLLNERERKRLYVLIFMMFVGGILESFGVSLVLPLVSAITDENAANSQICGFLLKLLHISDTSVLVRLLLIALAVTYLLKNSYLMWQNYLQFSFTANLRRRVQMKLLHYYTRVPYAFYLSSDSGSIVSNMTKDVSAVVELMNDFLLFYTEICVSAIMAVTVFVISPQMMLFMGVVCLLEYLGLILLLRSFMRKCGSVYRKELAQEQHLIIQIINGIKSIKVSRAETFFERRFENHAVRQIDAERKAQTLKTVPKLIIEAVTMAAVMMYLLLLLSMGENLKTIVPVLSAFVVAAVRLLPCVNRISTSVNGIVYNEASLNTILELFREIEKNHIEKNENLPGEPLRFEREIEFRNITFQYPGSDRFVLQQANLRVDKGQSVGIIGESGAGKTTAIDILLGLLSPQQGEVLVDGKNINANLPAWYGTVAYIPQEIFILNDTIRANVAFGADDSDIDDGKIWKALEEAQLADFVRSLPEGLDTGLGDKGIRFSGGQKQRVGIARALYRDPAILIFDEATSSLDNETEKSVLESICHLKGRKTMITIAHRLSTIENCDSVYRVENGKITPER